MWYVEQSMEEQECVDEQMDLWVNPEEVARRKWPAVQADVVLWSGPGLKVDLAESFI